MTQISRPFQIALLALGLLVAVWFIALRGHSATTGGSGSSASAPSSPAQAGKAPAPSPSTPSSSAAAEEKAAAAPTPIYHGAAPGVAGLTRIIAKAHQAVAGSQQNAKQVEQESAQASANSSSGTAAGASTTGNPPAAATTHKVTTAPGNKHTSATQGATVNKVASSGASTTSSGSTKASPPAMQTTVEGELKQGKMVTILFWNPRASVDESVRRELQVVGSTQGGKMAIHNARAAQVGSFGSITRAVQIYQTPTILIVNPRGQTTTLTGLQDVFSIQQAIDEARQS